ncbi:MAG TPA: alpha/beta hydrolase fold domain-containing protein [Steroidobacteraceae bacterium]|nr:alpha/beta hydrolase fold domain-containing protein [Steroidobacteraceae bacterium]
MLTLASLAAPAAGSGSDASAPPARAPGSPDPKAIPTLAAAIPYSQFASAEAARIWAELRKAPPEPTLRGDLIALRKMQSEGTDKALAEMHRLYPVTITSERLGGVRTDVVVPAEGITPRNQKRALISLHGGAFIWGAGSEAMMQAIPIAATSRIKVVSVDYRMAPEFKFPAASEDVAAVYQALLETYPAKGIGIFGCSAGGVLTAESVAWFAAHNLPQPGAIATLCGTGAEMGGDSAYLSWLLLGVNVVPPAAPPLSLSGLPYFAGADVHDPLVAPIESAALLERFPPTLLLAGSRDFAASSETLMQRRLWESGVDAELIIFDGLWHAFMIHPELPESREVYDILGRFFDRHLDAATTASAGGVH